MEIILNDEEREFLKGCLISEVEIGEDCIFNKSFDVWSEEELRRKVKVSRDILEKLK